MNNPVVIVHRDAWDWAMAWSTVVAAVLALVAVLCALWAIRHSDKSLLRERRMDFELGVLAQLAHACGNLWNASSSEVLALLELLPGELQGLREEVESRAAGPAFAGNERVLARHWAEYQQAVDRRRLDVRPPRRTWSRAGRG
jgi:hypothetical protein